MTLLVLPSSLGTTEELWDENVRAWEGRFRLLRYTHRGRTSVEELGRELVALLDDAGAERASICGVSLGGATAMWVAATHPERIDRLVLACTSARFGEPEPWLERAATVRQRGVEAIADTIVARWFTLAAPPELVARFRRQLVETPAEEYARLCEAVAAWDFRERLAEVQASTLVIGGADDPATPVEHQELLADGIPDARLAVLESAAHLANAERPDAFSRLVADHLATTVAEVA